MNEFYKLLKCPSLERTLSLSKGVWGGFILFFIFLQGYGQVTIDAELRPRSEFRSGFNQPLADTLKSAFVTQQRTRLNFKSDERFDTNKNPGCNRCK